MRVFFSCLIVGLLAACAPSAPDDTAPISPVLEPPPVPEGAETVTFERPAEAEADLPVADTPEAETETSSTAPKYWGVEDGEALTIMWEDLMPAESEEALIKAYEEFYAMLEKRYAANTTLLSQADPYGGIAEGSEFDYMPQLGDFQTVEELDGELVRIPGYVVPFDFEAKMRHREFLFVPYMGACIHSPPPPPNQIIFIRADPAIQIKDIWAPYWVEGTLQSEKTENDLGNTAYSLSMDILEPYPAP